MRAADQAPDTKAYRYQRIADAIQRRVDANHWMRDERLPSVRHFMHEYEASMSTVVRALILLESAGVLRSVPRSGWYLARKPAPPPAARAVAPVPQAGTGELVLRVLAPAPKGGAPLLSMGSTTLDPGLVPVHSLNRSLAAVARTQGHLGALPALGHYGLRMQIAKLMAGRNVHVAPDDILITSGDGHCLETILQILVPPGGLVAVECPTYFGNLQAIEALGLRTLEVATDGKTGIDLEALARAFERDTISAVIVTSNCQNPLGFSMSPEAKIALLELADRHGATVIDDDVYGDLHFQKRSSAALLSYDRSGRVVYFSSFSKTLSSNWRVGWIIPGIWKTRLLEQRTVRAASPSALPQAVLAHYLAKRDYQRHVSHLREVFSCQVPRVREAILRHFPSGTRVSEPSGGYVFWIELPENIDAVRLSELAFEQGVNVAPGVIFSSGRQFERHIRLSIGAPFSQLIETAIRTVGAAAQKLAARPPQPRSRETTSGGTV
ncbi:PLP-dependent aminotransferase family protein [Janthinobacterium sp.]|uniref:aminotransferase-like domain-containing protein n=1 Tax=Janthinobacterium sp. TaxID=1871054 RepID=UPI00293D5A0A|nr:PLP-dependent aminotransferase family protein [Janthinobacterium sp.]